MTDLVERLRKENSMPPYYGPPKLQEEAAARIEQLEKALREIAKLAQRNQMGLLATNDAFGKTWQIVRAALEERT